MCGMRVKIDVYAFVGTHCFPFNWMYIASICAPWRKRAMAARIRVQLD